MKLTTAIAIVNRVAPFAGEEVTAPVGGCAVAHPLVPNVALPVLFGVEGTPVTGWRIGTNLRQSDVRLGELEQAATVIRAAEARLG